MGGDFRLEDLPGVGRVTAEKLRRAGVRSVRVLAMMNPEELMEFDIDPIRAAKIIRSARQRLGLSVRPLTGVEVEREMLGLVRLSTGVNSIDELLGGGLEPMSIYEFAGEFGAGKTQLCHQLAVMVQLPPERGGLGARALYIDTEGTFSAQRLRAIAGFRGLDPSKALENTLVVRCDTVVSLEEAVKEVAPETIEEEGVKLVIVDSIIALYRAQFRGIEWLARRQQRLNYVLDWLKRLGRVYGTYHVITNQVLTNPMPGSISIKVPAGGNIIAHASTHRLFLRKAGGKHVMMVLDSPYLPRNASAEYKITDNGVLDAEE